MRQLARTSRLLAPTSITIARPPRPRAQAPQSMPRIFHQRNTSPLQTPATPGRTRNTSNNSKSSKYNKSMSGRNSKPGRSRIISGSRKRRSINPDSSSWNNSTNSKRNNWSKNTLSSNNSCSSASNQLRAKMLPNQKNQNRQADRNIPGRVAPVYDEVVDGGLSV